MSEPEPVEVRNDRDNGRLVIVWDDATRTQYPFDDLRNACPCASITGLATTCIRRRPIARSAE